MFPSSVEIFSEKCYIKSWYYLTDHLTMCRLDSLVGLFAVGCQPTATADPFGLRRSAYGLV